MDTNKHENQNGIFLIKHEGTKDTEENPRTVYFNAEARRTRRLAEGVFGFFYLGLEFV